VHSLPAFAALLLLTPTASPGPLAIGQKLQPFAELASLQGRKAFVLAFIATECPVSNAYNARMAAFAKEYAAKGVAFVGINSNRHETRDRVVQHAKQNGLDFLVLKDEGNAKADQLGAQVAPEVYVFDAGWTLRYRGRIDEDRSGSSVPSADLGAAVDALLEGREIRLKETKAFGCTIKRVPGREAR